MSANKRMKLFYVTQARGAEERALPTPEFVLFVNDPQLLGDTYARYLEAQIRAEQEFHGLPIMLNFRPRAESSGGGPDEKKVTERGPQNPRGPRRAKRSRKNSSS